MRDWTGPSSASAASGAKQTAVEELDAASPPPPRSSPALDIVIIGLTITSSWGNGHATTYRGLVRELAGRGHRVLFLEHDKPWYAANRDLPSPPYGQTQLYHSPEDLKERFGALVRKADLVIVGSYVPEGVAVGEWVTAVARASAFYDIDTPVTLAKLERGECEYLSPQLIGRYGLYLSFTGGPTLRRIERRLGSPMARALYCSVDPEVYHPEVCALEWDLGYLGTYSADRQRPLESLMLEPARRYPEAFFVVAGPQYPQTIAWPANVQRIEHVPPAEHRRFYNAQRFALNITRRDMVRSGYSPSVRLFEAAACGVPIVSDWWEGLDELLEPGREILIARRSEDTLHYLCDVDECDRQVIGALARRRVLSQHTAAHRAAELEVHAMELLARRS